MTGPFLHHETSLFETQSGRVPGSLDIACRNPRSALIDAIFVMQGKLAQLETDGFNDRELERLRAAIPAASGGD